ncbi:MAG: HAD-IA family hydrolase [bacterium]
MDAANDIPAFDTALFDAGLTLIHPVSTVEKIYAQYAARSGIPLPRLVSEIRRHFRDLFGAERREMAEGRDGFVWSDELDRQMWRRVCCSVAERIPGLTDEPEQWFEQLYEHFGRAETWKLFEDASATLEGLRRAGLRVGVVSNWDSRLLGILDGLELTPLLDTAVVSGRDGTRKPGAQIFQLALERLGADPAAVIMVGDSVTDDVEGAARAGLTGVLIHRGQDPPPAGVPVIRSLRELLPRA